MKYFKPEEFVCKGPDYCGHKFLMSQHLVYMLDQIRETIHKPIVITSGTRCTKWNVEQGGAPESAHLVKGKYSHAVDISCPDSSFRYAFLLEAFKYFNRIGIGSSFIHVDIDPENSPNVVWTY